MGLGTSDLNIPGGGTNGYHVLRVQDGSPGAKAGLEAYFDYIVSINSIRLNKDNDQFRDVVRQALNHTVQLGVYNSRTQLVRQVPLIPQNNWGGQVRTISGKKRSIESLLQGSLGLSIRFADLTRANENVWHVLEVKEKSPAARAGLIAHTDYIVGADVLLSSNDDFHSLIELNQGKTVKFYVYNLETEKTREVMLTPNLNWGGEGSLGCGIGFGYLHRIPFHRIASVPATKSHAGKIPLLTPSSPPVLNFTLQPTNLPPLTITMPDLILPSLISFEETNSSSQEVN